MTNRRIYLIALILLTTGVFYLKFGFRILDTSFTEWLYLEGSDMVPDVATWEYYRYNSLGLRLIDNYAWPQVTGVGNTNIVPWMAAPLKLFSDYLPEKFQYFGWFFLICYVLQVYFGDKLLRLAGVRNYFFRFAGVFFLLLSAPFLDRSWHIALNAHFFILAGFCIYFNNAGWTKKAIQFSLVSFFSLLTHPYLVLFPLVIGFGCFLKELVLKNIHWPQMIMANGINLIAVVFAAWLSGMFYLPSDSAGSSGFGWYSAALDTFINNIGRTSFGFMSFPRYFEGQYEGSAYLGFGLIVLWTLLLIQKKFYHFLFGSIKRNWPMMLCLFALTIYAFGFQITLFDWFRLGFDWNENSFIYKTLAIFRSSGRYIWAAHEWMAIIPVIFLYRVHKSRPLIIGLIATCLLIQFADIRKCFKSYDFGNHYVKTVDHDQLVNLLTSVEGVIYTFPIYNRQMTSPDDIQYLVASLGKLQKKITAGHLPRPDHKAQGEQISLIERAINDGKWLFGEDDVLLTSKQQNYNFKFMEEADTMISAKSIGLYTLLYNKKNQNLHQKLMDLAEDNLQAIHLSEYLKNYTKGYYWFITSRDDASTKFDPVSREVFSNAQLSKIGYRQSYTGFWKDGIAVNEKMSNQSIIMDTTIMGHRIELASVSGTDSKDEWIRVDGKNYSSGFRGLNIVVLNEQFLVVSHKNFDTYRTNYAAHYQE